MLRGMGLEFVVVDEHYLRVGEPKKVQGWILHLSVIKTQVQKLMEIVLPMLVEEKISFRIVKDYRSVKDSLDGLLGYHLLGKIITIYCETDSSLVSFAKMLIEATKEFKGPAIPTDAHLGNIVYARYGGINPVLQADSTGCFGRYIYNAKGELEMETYEIPFSMPRQIAWPFPEIEMPLDEKSRKILQNNYLITSLLKQDVKGEVYKALRVKRFYPEWCIIKEGRRNMWSDDCERDIQDRLRWQYNLQKDLHGHVSVPEPYALFEQKEGTYITMQYVKGSSLYDVVQKIYNGKNWRELEKMQRSELLGYLLQIIRQCEKLHKKGYVHRDLALPNFILNKDNTLVMIDLELAYSLQDKTPCPPFRLGTPGFMSPEQIKTKTPTEKEDIYALGAVMIELFTSIHPRKFGIYDLHELKENMLFLIGHKGIANLISQCMHADPQRRPLLSVIQKKIEQYRQELTELKNATQEIWNREPDQEYLQLILKESLSGMRTLISENPIKTRYKEIEGNPIPELTLSLGWYTGISGIMGVLCQADQRTPVNGLEEAYATGLSFIEKKLNDERPILAPGLHLGAAGVALSITTGLENKWIRNEREWKLELLRLLRMPNTRKDMAHGVAGQGLTTLRSLPYLPQEEAYILLHRYTEIILSAQQDDGSWTMDENPKLKSAGFSVGSTGILFFLLGYASLSSYDTRVRESILKGLDWLKGPTKTVSNYRWLINNKHKTVNLGLDGDITGTARCFIKAYTTLKDSAYRLCAEEILRNIPSQLVTNELSMAMGLAGLGEVYLEAASVFKSEEWKIRLNCVINFLLNTSHLKDRDLRYWIVTNSNPPSLDLMSGSGGVLHLLMRYLNPNSIGLPDGRAVTSN